VHSECETLQSHALPLHGPYYLAMIAPVLVLGIISAGIYEWMLLAALILGGSWLVWWATERAWGKFS